MFALPKKWHKWLDGLHRFVEQPWYIPFVALLAGLDSFLIIFPIDILLVTRVLLKKEQWLKSAFIVALGSALGGLLLASFVHWDRDFVVRLMTHVGMGTAFSSDQGDVGQYIHRYGALGVGLTALSFIPMQIAVIIAAGENVPVVSIFICALVGRSLKYTLYAFLGAYFPEFAKKLLPRK